MTEILKNNSGESGNDTQDNNPWGEKYKESVSHFNSDKDAELARNVAVVTFVVVLVLSAVINLLVIIPGFKYSMKGTCKTWAFVMAIIGIISVVASLFNIANSPSSIVSILVDAAGIILYIIVVFMLRKKEA